MFFSQHYEEILLINVFGKSHNVDTEYISRVFTDRVLGFSTIFACTLQNALYIQTTT